MGARAARMGTKTGSLEVGKLADIVLVSRDDYDQYPSFDPVMTLGQNTMGRYVRTVIIDRKVVMKDRRFLTVDVEKLRPPFTPPPPPPPPPPPHPPPPPPP